MITTHTAPARASPPESSVSAPSGVGGHSLREACRAVARAWPFTSASYAEMPLTREHALRHVVLHLGKDLGRLLAAVEPLDHGGQADPREPATERAVRNVLIEALRAVEILALDSEDLLASYLAEQASDGRD